MDNAEYQQESLNQSAFDMLNLCTSQLEKSIEAFVNHDSDLSEEVIHKENRVNAMDIKIEKDCEKFLALFTPVAVDLRFVMAILKINSDLERIGDHAFNIANYVVEEDKAIPSQLFEAVNFDKMMETIKLMLNHITIAFEDKDVKIARKVFKKDKVLDKINIKSFQILEMEIQKDQTLIKEALFLFSVIKKLERVGDLIKNIAEEIIFYTDAEILKHKRKK
ncbi:phosphate signaling complex protein PhoU [Maribacter sp. HTCC2170]|uniref:phosphate signaling complex protein PhoU n=1 Tax=Maribacter sp. (strain HTCC2170 / KCCM 42371) TaxID=313603 RepID=UPI00006BD3E3|nr:phosphate signaling complex protein PhoU [Maribacter sp. HTCC2170]EAR02593.1 putative phosphate transport chemotaxis-related protein [Maribacter sp. HTCC2170]